jgi:hypothetical protein
VVGGTFGTDTENSYYRIDFNSSEPGHTFGQILRNWQYVFNITTVTARGLPDPDTAATTVANSMTIEVTAWNENVSKVEFVGTGDYIMLSTNAIELPYSTGGSKTFYVRSTVPFDWQLDSGTTANSSATATLTDDNYSVVMTPSTQTGDYTDYTFTVTTLSANDNASDTRPAGVFITAQGATLSVSLTQAASKVLTTKVRVMSAGANFGSLGETFTPFTVLGSLDEGTATQMRYILLNQANFGPTGVVKMGGFNLSYVDESFFDDANQVDHFAYVLEQVDVLNMCYPVNPSAAISKVICDWLWADENRVLFVMHDTANGNPNLITEINSRVESTYDTTWSLLASFVGLLPGASTLTVKGMAPLSVDDGNRQFLQGPFGSVTNLNTMFNVTDGTAGGLIPPMGLVPLVYYGYANVRSTYAVTAIDTAHRIVYIGESNSLHNQMAGSTTAPLPTDGNLNLIYSNLWAWVVGQVLTE